MSDVGLSVTEMTAVIDLLDVMHDPTLQSAARKLRLLTDRVKAAQQQIARDQCAHFCPPPGETHEGFLEATGYTTEEMRDMAQTAKLQIQQMQVVPLSEQGDHRVRALFAACANTLPLVYGVPLASFQSMVPFLVGVIRTAYVLGQSEAVRGKVTPDTAT